MLFHHYKEIRPASRLRIQTMQKLKTRGRFIIHQILVQIQRNVGVCDIVRIRKCNHIPRNSVHRITNVGYFLGDNFDTFLLTWYILDQTNPNFLQIVKSFEHNLFICYYIIVID